MAKAPIREVTFAQYHRNGSGGEGFTEVRFLTDWNGNQTEHVIAIVTETECYMVSMDNPEHRWRGSDFYGDLLREWIDDNTCDDCFGIGSHKEFCE